MTEQTAIAAQEHHHLFSTRLGACGIAWSERGVTRVQLPERNPAATEPPSEPSATTGQPVSMPLTCAFER